MTLQQEWFTLLIMICCGIYIGMATDTYRTVVTPFFRKVILRSTLEILYWICQTAIVYYILYKMNNGVLRFYFFIACLLGYSIYVVILQATYIKCMHFLMKIAYTLIRVLYKLLVQPIFVLLRFCWKIITGVCIGIGRLLKPPILWCLSPLRRFFKKDSKIVTNLCSFYSTIYTKLKIIWKR